MRAIFSILAIVAIIVADTWFWQIGGYKLGLGLILFFFAVSVEIGLRVDDLEETTARNIRDIYSRFGL